MGFAGNSAPQIVMQTVLGSKVDPSVPSGGNLLDDLDLFIGDEAVSRAASKRYSLFYPIRHGQVDNWDLMERFWQTSIFKYLKCEPEDHPFLLTEPPLNPPENRALTAEIMFESFNVPGLHIAVQAVLALAASWAAGGSSGKAALTGTVVDSGDGVTHIIPVVDGFVIGSSIRSMPVAGREVTLFIQSLLRDRDLGPEATSFEIAKLIKERLCFTSSDLIREFSRFDAEPSKFISSLEVLVD